MNRDQLIIACFCLIDDVLPFFILVELTEQGRELIDTALIPHVANETRLLQPLSREEQHALAVLLRKWLSSLEHHS